MSTEYDKVFIVEKPSSSDSEYVTHSPISYVVDSALNYRDFFMVLKIKSKLLTVAQMMMNRPLPPHRDKPFRILDEFII